MKPFKLPQITPLRLVFVTLVVIFIAMTWIGYVYSLPAPAAWMVQCHLSWLVMPVLRWIPTLVLMTLFVLVTWIVYILRWSAESPDDPGFWDFLKDLFRADEIDSNDVRQRMMNSPQGRLQVGKNPLAD